MKFGRTFLASIVVLVTGFLGAAWLIDPRGDFGTGLFPTVVYDARATKLRLFDTYQAQAPITGLVLGSSRVMKIRPADLDARTGLRFFNFSVDRALPDDMLAVYWWVRQQGPGLKMVLIGLDAEALITDDRLHWKLEQNAELMQAHATALGATPSSLASLAAAAAVYKRMLTVSYLTDAALSVRVWLRPQENLLNAEFGPGGYFRYPRWEMERLNGTFRFERSLKQCLEGHAQDFRPAPPSLSRHHATRIEQLIAQARRDGAEVRVFLTGFHPETVRYLKEHTTYAASIASARAFLTDLGARYGIETHDLSEIDRYDGTPTGWYDCGHIDEDNARLIVDVLTRRRRA